MLYAEKISHAAEWIKNSKHLVVLTGAGISTESGLPDYRGIWSSDTDKDTFYRVISVNWKNVKPNNSHTALVKFRKT